MNPGTAGPALIGGPAGNPQPGRPGLPPCWDLVAPGTLQPLTRSTPPPGHHLHNQTRSGTHPETHKDSHWLVARHPRPQTHTHCIPDARWHTIETHTHSIPDTHTFVVTHSFLSGGNTGAHSKAQPALDIRRHSA